MKWIIHIFAQLYDNSEEAVALLTVTAPMPVLASTGVNPCHAKHRYSLPLQTV